MFKLMVKTHNKTGLKYLCITKRKNFREYQGSGVHWRKHLLKHGNDFSTKLIYVTKDYELFLCKCYYYSELYNVAKSKEWANLIPESGYDNIYNIKKGECNLVTYHKQLSLDERVKLYRKRAKSIYKNHCCRKNPELWEEVKQKNRLTNQLYWQNLPIEEQQKRMNKLKPNQEKFFKEKGEKYQHWKQNISDTMSKKFLNLTDEEKELLSQRNRNARLNTSENVKQQRKEKIQQVYATGKHDALFKRYSEERKGKNNPSCKIFEYENNEYTIGELCNLLNLPRHTVNKMIKENPEKFRRIK